MVARIVLHGAYPDLVLREAEEGDDDLRSASLSDDVLVSAASFGSSDTAADALSGVSVLSSAIELFVGGDACSNTALMLEPGALELS